MSAELTAAEPAVLAAAPFAAPAAAGVDTSGAVAVAGLATGVRRKATGADPLGGTTVAPDINEALRRRQGGGRPLEQDHAARMGEAMGADFSGVRVHDDNEADAISRSIQATAFTTGSDVYFTRGSYAPGTSTGDHLLAHELAHVAQGSSGRSSAGGPVIGAANDPAEAAADAMADLAIGRLRRQAARVEEAETPAVPATDALAPLRRQADTIHRWTFAGLLDGVTDFFGDLFGGTKGSAPAKDEPTPTKVEDAPKVDATPTKVEDAPKVEETPAKVEETPAKVEATPTKVEVAPSKEEIAPVVKPPTAQEKFAAACEPQTAPASKDAAQLRMQALREVIKGFSAAEREAVASDPAMKAKGRAHLGDLFYMSLLAALDTNVKKTSATPEKTKVKHHLTGAEADTFITTNAADYPHINTFISAAAGAGKKGEGYVASISPEDWDIAYEAQYVGETASVNGLNTNAFIGNQNPDRPAMLHADRGTPSTAIHESMHRYSVLTVLHTYGSPLNEGMTEYFTRVLTDQNAQPAKNGGPERNNYDANVGFVRSMIFILGGSKTDQETVLGQIYFEGKIELLEAKFKAACKAKDSTLTDGALTNAWVAFKTDITAGSWAAAKQKLPTP